MTYEPIDLWTVIANFEDKCAAWAAGRPLPSHWRALGFRGTRAQCEEHIAHLDQERRADVLRRYLEQDRVWP